MKSKFQTAVDSFKTSSLPSTSLKRVLSHLQLHRSSRLQYEDVSMRIKLMTALIPLKVLILLLYHDVPQNESV